MSKARAAQPDNPQGTPALGADLQTTSLFNRTPLEGGKGGEGKTPTPLKKENLSLWLLSRINPPRLAHQCEMESSGRSIQGAPSSSNVILPSFERPEPPSTLPPPPSCGTLQPTFCPTDGEDGTVRPSSSSVSVNDQLLFGSVQGCELSHICPPPLFARYKRK